MKKVFVAAALAACAGLVHAADKRAFTVQDLVMMERVSDPRVSPDGRFVAYSLRETNYAENKASRSVWIASLSGDASPRRLTGAATNSDSPRWSPDSKWLYFLSTRSGSVQVWRLSLEGGEAQQVTSYPLDVEAYSVAPDGAHLAIAMQAYTDCRDLACTKKRVDERVAQKTSGQLYDRLFVRHWDTWSDGRRNQLFVGTIGADGKVSGEPKLVSRDIDGDVPSKPFGDESEFTFTRDGREMIFSARIPGKTEAWSTNLDLFRVSIEGDGKPRNLTIENQATDTGPVISPDGKWLAYRAMKRATFESDRYGVWLMDLGSGAKREVAPNWDRSAEAIAFSPDGKTLYVSAEDVGQKKLFAMDPASGKVTPLTGEGTVSAFSVGPNGIVYAMNTLIAPDQLFAFGLQGGGARALTLHNAQRLGEIGFTEFEQFSFPGWHDEPVHGYVTKPFGWKKGKKYPVAFLIHGGPQGSFGNDFHYRWNPQVWAGMGYGVVVIDFHGSTGYGQAFTDSISGDWGGKPLEDLQKGLKYALEHYDFLDGTKACAMGASYGGYMINWIAGRWPEAFRCLVNHDGDFDLRQGYYATEELWFDEWERGGPQYLVPENFEKYNPVNYVNNWKTPMLVIQGGLDYRVPLEHGLSTFTALQRRSVPSQFLYFPDENHWVLKPQNSVQWHQTVQAWLTKWIGP